MQPLREWLRPPRTLLLILFLLALVSVTALGWFGWRLGAQEELVEAQRSQDRLEQAADRISATIRGTLAETGERLQSSDPDALPNGDLLLVLTENGISATPTGKILYYPFPSQEPEAKSAIFTETELFEFTRNQPEEAIRSYRRLASSPDAATRAGAIMRIARILRNTRRRNTLRIPEAISEYERLAAISNARVAGVPAALAARHAIAELAGRRGDSEALLDDLRRGRWHLTRGQFTFYWSEAARLLNTREKPPAESVAFSEAAAKAWLHAWLQKEPPLAQEAVWIDGKPLLLIARGSRERRTVLVAKPETFFKRVSGEAIYAIVDAEGRVLAGNRAGPGSKAGATRAAVRTAAESQLPWTLYVVSGPTAASANPRQRFLLLGISIIVLFLVIGTYFIARAIRRETETLRMQSEFVSAVSHEFRSPITSMRQLSEILALGRVPTEERRQLYYETLVKESTRLQRLIETLLNFGKMEAGASQYHFEEIDAAQLVHRVVSELEPQIEGSGRHIELRGTPSGCLIDADPDAICVALRNLLDNALKYSPGCPAVWIEWSVRNQQVAIEVRDKGRGIALAERKAIFRKFVRGTAAAVTNVKGSGLGLAMVRHIVSAHGGEITVASEVGEGSAFTLLLPRVERA